MAKSKGYFAVYRDIFTHWVYQDAIVFRAWIYLIGNVNHTQEVIRYEGEWVTIEPSQMLTSVRKLAQAWGTTEKKTRNILKAFENERMIKLDNPSKKWRMKSTGAQVTTKGRGTLLTVENWTLYQYQGHNAKENTRAQDTKGANKEKRPPKATNNEYSQRIYTDAEFLELEKRKLGIT